MEAPILVNARSGSYPLFGKYLKQRIPDIELYKYMGLKGDNYFRLAELERVSGAFYKYTSQNPGEEGKVIYVPEEKDRASVDSPPVRAGGMKRKRTLRKRRV